MDTTVLIVEAHAEIRAIYTEALRTSGFVIVGVADVSAACDHVASSPPRMVVASYDPSTRDERLRFCQQLKDAGHALTTTVLLTSTKVSDEDLRSATAAGALAVTLTPRDGAKLRGLVEGVLVAQQRRFGSVDDQRPLDERPAIPRTPID